jgi:hypothetical protein
MHQLFLGRIVAEKGKIKVLREALNSFQAPRGTIQ